MVVKDDPFKSGNLNFRWEMSDPEDENSLLEYKDVLEVGIGLVEGHNEGFKDNPLQLKLRGPPLPPKYLWRALPAEMTADMIVSRF